MLEDAGLGEGALEPAREGAGEGAGEGAAEVGGLGFGFASGVGKMARAVEAVLACMEAG